MTRLLTVLSVLFLLAACDHRGMNAGIHQYQHFDAYGNEPFWHARVDGNILRYTTPENLDGTETTVQREDMIGGVIFRGELDGHPIRFSITNLQCTDSMSGEKFPYSAVREWENSFHPGCAKPGTPNRQRAGGAPDATE